MLSVLNATSVFSAFANTKCAEVFCQSADSFSIICTFCEMKNFEFDDFLLHFKNVHLDSNLVAAASASSATAPVKETAAVIKGEKFIYESESEMEEADQMLYQEQPLHINDIKCSPIIFTEAVQQQVTDALALDETWQNSTNNDDYSGSANDYSDDDGDNSADDEQYTQSLLKKSETIASIDATVTAAATTTATSPAVKHECSECGKSYKTSKALAAHITRIHQSTEKTHKCPRCDASYGDERSLNTHMQRVHDGFPCDECDKTYKNKDTLRYHKMKHSGQRDYICDVDNCGKAFFHKKRLSCHKKYSHTNTRNYVCEMCGFSTKTSAALVVHKRTHTGEKPFACSVCNRCFASQSQLSEHKAMHATDRPHVCDVCGATFARPKGLYHHKHLHLGIKKFVCKLCGKAYAQAAGLCAHMRQHKADRNECL